MSKNTNPPTPRIDDMVKARRAIVAELKRRRLAGDQDVLPLDDRNSYRWHHPQDNYYSGSGRMACPVCSTGTLHYSRAGFNGHVRAKCTAVDCVAWIE